MIFLALEVAVLTIFCVITSIVVNAAACKIDPNNKTSFILSSHQEGKQFENTRVISLNETLKEIYSNDIPILPHYHGPHLKFMKEAFSATETQHSHGKKVKIHFNCKTLFHSLLSYKGKDNKEDCSKMTPEFLAKYTCDGHIQGNVECLHNNSSHNHNHNHNPSVKQKEEVASVIHPFCWNESFITEACQGFSTCGNHGSTACSESMIKYGDLYVKDKVGLTLGMTNTQYPWLEGGLIAYGAKKVIAVEYNPIESSFDKVSHIHPYDLAEKFVHSDTTDIEALQVDFIYTFSSLAHDGFGRHGDGDPMNPYADLESIARAHCMLKKDGVLFLALGLGPDYVGNSSRVYGKLRMSMILPMWDPIDLINNRVHLNDTTFVHAENNQPVWVLRKKNKIGLH